MKQITQTIAIIVTGVAILVFIAGLMMNHPVL